MAVKWEDIKKIAESNAVFLDEQPDDFLDKDATLSERDLILLLWLLIDDLETEDGVIKKSRKNFILIGTLDKIFNNFALGAGFILIGKLVGRLQKVVSNNIGFYSAMLGKPEESFLSRLTTLINGRLGIGQKGELTKDGYLHSMLYNKTIRNEAKELFYKSILGSSTPAGLRGTVKDYITGTGPKGKAGAIQKFYSKFAYDTFGQIDRMASVEFREQYNLTRFLYAGTLIKTSRPFCRKKIHGIYTLAEAEKWIFETPGPLGISEATYDPILDLGGAGCRHAPFFLSDEMADELKRNGYSGFNG